MPKSPALKAAQSPTNAAIARKTRSKTPVVNGPAGANAVAGKGNTPKQSRTPGKAPTSTTRHSPRIARPKSTGTQERSPKHAESTPASAEQATRPGASTPKRRSAAALPTAQTSKEKALGISAAVGESPLKRKTPAAPVQPTRSPLSKATPASATTPAGSLTAAAQPSAAVPGSKAPSTIKTHQRRRRASVLGTAVTPAGALVQHSRAAAGAPAAQTAPVAVGAKRNARVADDHELGTLSPGARRKRRATMPAGPRSVEVHADPEELKYWREVEEEQLITDSGDDSSSDAGEGEQQQEEQEQ